MVEVSEYPMRFRGRIFRKTDSPYDKEFCALSEYPEFHKTLISLARIRETSY